MFEEAQKMMEQAEAIRLEWEAALTPELAAEKEAEFDRVFAEASQAVKEASAAAPDPGEEGP
jgi:hypothetical protein